MWSVCWILFSINKTIAEELNWFVFDNPADSSMAIFPLAETIQISVLYAPSSTPLQV